MIKPPPSAADDPRGKRLTPTDVLEGAAMLIKIATDIEFKIKAAKGTEVRLRKTDMLGIATALRGGAEVLDFMTGCLERGERFDERLSR